MPPYASQEHGHSPVFHDHDHDHDVSFVEIPIGSKLVEDRTTETIDGSSLNPIVEEKNSPQSIFERLLDFNPCTIKIINPSSALFKVRICSECGEKVHKFKGGYEKEHRLDTIVDEDTSEESVVESKVYFHSGGGCLQLREDRKVHKDNGFGAVLIDLEDFFDAKARKKLEAEERRARRAREEEEAAQKQWETEVAAAAAAEAASASAARNELLEVSLKDRKFAKRARRALKSFSLKSCRGKQGMPEESAFEGMEII